MQKKLHGPFISIDTAKAAVTSLLASGYDRSDITLLASSLIADDLTDATNIQVISDLGNENGTSGLKKIKSLFKKDDEVNHEGPYSAYKDDIAHGKIVVLVDEK